MFSLKVIDTDSFLDMSPTAQNLYFHLGMRADDDGFVSSPKKIMKMVSAPDDDFKVLVAKGFVVLMATNGVCVISHWKMNNLIKSDRYTETIYLEEKARLNENNGIYSVDILGSKMVPVSEPQVRLGKVRIGKDREGKDTTEQSSEDIVLLLKSFESINPSIKRMYGNTTQRKACRFLIDTHSFERVTSVIEKTLPRTNGMQFFPTIATPVQLQDKWVALESAVRKYQTEKQTPKNKVAF